MPSRVPFRPLLDAVLEPLLLADEHGEVLYANPAAEQLLHWTPGEPPESTLEALFGVNTEGVQGDEPVRISALPTGDGVPPVELLMVPIELGGVSFIAACLRGADEPAAVGDGVLVLDELRAQSAVSRVIAECVTMEEALPRLVDAIVPTLGFDGGLLWMADGQTRELRAVAAYPSAGHSDVARFVARRRHRTFQVGEGVLARALATARVTVSVDLGHDNDEMLATQNAFSCAAWVPLPGARSQHGILEVLAHAPERFSRRSVRLLEALAVQVGQFLDRLMLEADRERLLREERAARESAEAQCHSLYESLMQAPAPITIQRGPGLEFELVNPLAEQLLEESGPSANVATRGARQVYETGQSVHVRELKVHERYFNAVRHPLRGDSGAVEGVLSIATEVTEQVIARRASEAAERRATLIAEAIPQLVWVAGKDGSVEYCNRRWLRYTGRRIDEAMGNGWLSLVHPGDAPAAMERWRDAVLHGKEYDAEYRYRRADGVFRWFLVRACPLRDATGQVVQWFGTLTDIDGQKRAEETNRLLGELGARLSESLDQEEMLKGVAELLVSRMADCCVVHLWDADSASARTLVAAHRDAEQLALAQTLGERLGRGPAIAQVVRAGQPKLMRKLTSAEAAALMVAFRPASMVVVPLAARGRTFGTVTLLSTSEARQYSDGDLEVALELADRAARAVDNARLYEEAQEAVRVRDDFLSVASHELKTPLTPLLLALDTLARHGTDPRFDKKLESMRRQVHRLEKLVTSLLDITRITGRRLELELEEVELEEIVREVVARLSEEAKQRKCPIRVHAEEGLLGRWDRLRVDQVLQNLLSNALKFGAGRPVEVQVRRIGELAELVVEDHGIGIAPDDQARIFERFERAVSSRQYGGFGLGLWIARQIVEAHGGEIHVDSAPGRGTTFRVSLPLNARETHPHA